VDNCPDVRNPVQRNGDSDGIGDLCDKCPEITDPSQPDADFDGESDACDCAETLFTDFEKRRPPPIEGLRFRDLLGMVNQRVAAAAERVVLMVAGIPLEVKAPVHASPISPVQAG
jgi:hypothetical protein